MRFFFVVLTSLCASVALSNAHAIEPDFANPREIKCTIDNIFKNVPRDVSDGRSYQFGVVDVISASCDQGLRLEAIGYGLGVRLQGIQVIGLGCFGGILPGKYWGAKVAAGYLVGMNIGFFANRHRFCYLGSADILGAAVSATVSKITIKSRN